ncbi:hypothetical protein GLW00_08040 [Halobacillus litoralis]|uniref:Uncharacterized protein n=1 Tax=Halobacillus litoralis TaxID=45668 RepID=A0A845FB13_9BACI|nr:hypothetical protein [Halobacillus litoralis]MYL70797.1 hypothetical protein [Halobacillus litoralis]
MDQKRPNNSKELESKLEKLSLYKEMLQSLQKTNVIDDYLLIKQESHDSKNQTEGVLKKMDEYHYNAEQRSQQLAAQIQSVKETVNGLQKDIDFIKEKMDRLQVHDLMEKMNRFMDNQGSAKKAEEVNEVTRLTQEIQQLKQQMQTVEHQKEIPVAEHPVKQKGKVQTSDFRKLQNMLQSKRISPQRNDYHQPMSHQHPYTSYQQNYSGNTQGFQGPSSFPKPTRAKAGKSKTYVNPQFDFNQQTTIKANSKKNDKETAHVGINKEKTTKKTNIQFQLMKPESAQMAIYHAEAQKPRIMRNESNSENNQIETKDHSNLPSSNESMKKKERSLLSIFQRWNS